jgi:hypothetical protein
VFENTRDPGGDFIAYFHIGDSVATIARGHPRALKELQRQITAAALFANDPTRDWHVIFPLTPTRWLTVTRPPRIGLSPDRDEPPADDETAKTFWREYKSMCKTLCWIGTSLG